jgi:hypothetical protein
MHPIAEPTDPAYTVTFDGVAANPQLVETIRRYARAVDAGLDGRARCRRVSVERTGSLYERLPVRVEVRVALCGGAAEFSLSRYGADEFAAVRYAFERVAERLEVACESSALEQPARDDEPARSALHAEAPAQLAFAAPATAIP